MKTKRLLALLLSMIMVLGILPMAASSEYEEEEYVEVPIPVTTEGKTYSLFTEEYLDDRHGISFLYVIEKGGRFYTPAHPGEVGDYEEKESIPSVDITEYWDEETNTFSGIPDSANVGVMQYQYNPFPAEYGYGSLFLNGDIMFSLSVPFEDNGEAWFGSIDYYDRDNTYGYDRALWEAKGDGKGYFYDRYTDWYGDKKTVYGVLALNSSNRFALKNYSQEYTEKEDEADIDVGGYLYAAPCGHATTQYAAHVEPTCMDKGCKEYWYCAFCQTYFADEKCATPYPCKPVLPALGHDYGDTDCKNCERPIPGYTKITSYEQFRTIKPGASFIAVAEIDDGNGGIEYYVLKEPLNIVGSDVDEDGMPDILLVDENANGVSDVLEQDLDGDGVADAMMFDGTWGEEYLDGVLDEMEIEEYLFYLEQEYTNGYMAPFRALDAIPVTPENGVITVKDLGALEFIMERKYPDSELEDQYYGDGATVKDYENDFTFRIPNFWVRPVVTIDNNYYQMPYEQGDSMWWGVLFGKDVKTIADHYYDETYPDDAAILYTESFHSMNSDGQLEHALRFLINGDEKHFIMTTYSFWEEIEGTQYPIYLYCSDPGENAHEHEWSEWEPYSEDVHKRVCTVEGCDAFDLASHTPGEECTPDPDNPELGHWTTCTVCNGQFHDYHTTKKKPGSSYTNYWEDAEDGVHHVVYCTKCQGPAEYEEHNWTDWWLQTNALGESTHMRRCSTYACYRYEYRDADDHIYESTVTTPPTCTEPGVMTYTCIADDCNHSHTEEIPALGHDWGEWETDPSDPSCEIRECLNDPSHTETRSSHECVWTDWYADGDEHHKRDCMDDTCDAFETLPHEWDEGVITTQPTCTEPGVKTYTCTVCGHTVTEEIPVADHSYEAEVTPPTCTEGGYTTYTCACGDSYVGDETQPLGHDYQGEVTPPTCTQQGYTTYTCSRCGDSYVDDYVDPVEHSYETKVVEPTCTEGGYTVYVCACGEMYEADETQPLGHDFGEWVMVEPGLESRTCNRCGETETREAQPDFDTDGDGEVTEADAELLLSVLVGPAESDNLEYDMDFDGKLTIYDCVLLLQQIS